MLIAVYKGDLLLFIGSKIEIAKHFKVKLETVDFWLTPTNHKRDHGKRKIAFYLED